MKKPSKLLLSYLAGFADGEGSININANDRGFRVDYESRFVVVNTNKEIIFLFQSIFGGNVHRRKKIAHRKRIWVWSTASRLSVNAIKLLIPYLKLKKSQAELVLEWSKTIKRVGAGGHNKKTIKRRLRIVKKMHTLNQTGGA